MKKDRMDEIISTRRRWATPNSRVFHPCSSTYKRLMPGFYQFEFGDQGPYFVRAQPNPEKLFSFPDTNVDMAVREIDRF